MRKIILPICNLSLKLLCDHSLTKSIYHSYFLAIVWVVIIGFSTAGAQNKITFWTTEVEKDRLETQKEIARAFTKKTGIDLRVVPVQENLLTQRITAAFAARSLPDVVFHPIDFTIGWSEAGILDNNLQQRL